MQKILVSACLLGARVRYHGGDARAHSEILDLWAQEGRLVALCPEMLGGLPTPRPAAEIVGGPREVPGGQTVRVMTADAADVTAPFRLGAEISARTADEEGIRIAILKDGSPSCGSTRVHDGTFSGHTVPGEGITASLLRSRSVAVFSEAQLDEAAVYLARLEHSRCSS